MTYVNVCLAYTLHPALVAWSMIGQFKSLSWPVIGRFWFDNTNPKTQDTAHTKTVRKTSQSKDINPKLLRCIRNEMKRNESEIIYK